MVILISLTSMIIATLNWTNHIGAEIFPDQFLPPSYFSNIVVSAQGEDVGFWAGWYGPGIQCKRFRVEISVWD